MRIGTWMLAFLALAGALGSDSFARAPLDPRYPRLRPPVTLGGDAWRLFEPWRGFLVSGPARRSELGRMLPFVSGVRDQESRSTCSTFSAVALLETVLALDGVVDAGTVDLSEQWLEYQVMRQRDEEGSFSDLNFDTILAAGMPDERLWSYAGEPWVNADRGEARARCGGFEGLRLRRCLRGQRDPELMNASDGDLIRAGGEFHDPEFLAARRQAFAFRDEALVRSRGTAAHVETTEEVKSLLARGVPLTLDLDFYYGAWNHPEAVDHGISRSDADWAAGVVGYPAPGSADRAWSKKDATGHSVLILGYDDSITVTTRQLMTDGTTREFRYRGVYWFKNSWGAGDFGVKAELGGQVRPGFGMITQRYAHEFGSFYRLPLRRRRAAVQP